MDRREEFERRWKVIREFHAQDRGRERKLIFFSSEWSGCKKFSFSSLSLSGLLPLIFHITNTSRIPNRPVAGCSDTLSLSISFHVLCIQELFKFEPGSRTVQARTGFKILWSHFMRDSFKGSLEHENEFSLHGEKCMEEVWEGKRTEVSLLSHMLCEHLSKTHPFFFPASLSLSLSFSLILHRISLSLSLTLQTTSHKLFTPPVINSVDLSRAQ